VQVAGPEREQQADNRTVYTQPRQKVYTLDYPRATTTVAGSMDNRKGRTAVMDDHSTPQLTADAYFAIIPEWILDAPISPTAVRAFALLQRYANNHNTCWPSRTTLAGRMRCSTDTVDRALKELVNIDALTIQPRTAVAGQPQTNLYTLHMGVAAQMPRGSRMDAEGVAAQMRNKPKKKNQSQEQTSSSSEDDDFNTFWNTYPRKVGKGAARKAWKTALKKTDPTTILEAVNHYRITCPQDPTYIAHPTTWLNAERWLDNTTPTPPPAPSYTPPPLCGKCRNGWVYVTRKDGTEAVAPCPCQEAQQ